MKIVITKDQLKTIRENTSKKFNCEKCEHSWEIETKDKHPYLCHMCGYDSNKKKHNYDELENFWKNYKKEEVTEKWSEKYKKSINCNNPKGFSQRAHCQGKKKSLKESTVLYGYNLEEIKKALKILSSVSDTMGDKIPLDFKLYGYHPYQSEYGFRRLELYIDVDSEDGTYNNLPSEMRYRFSMELLDIFEMMGLYSHRSMHPSYNFYFNKRSLEGITII